MELQESWKKRLKEWQEQNKKSFAEWWNKKSNSAKVLCAAILSAIIFSLIYFTVIKNSSHSSHNSQSSGGYWNFIILIVSSPVAFVIWHFRDENQRKDINLKEFQKLSEWVSGAHLPEIKIVEKSITKSSFTTDNESAASPEKKITEQTEECSKEYGQKPDNAHLGTFSKWNGAVALQISAIYNLLPFFRGDYGESFRLPAFNLLKSAWQVLQQDELNKLNKLSLRKENFSIMIERNNIIKNLRQKALSPIGISLTHVLLSKNRENTQLNLQNFLETMRLNLCLAGMNLSGVDLSGVDLSGIDLSGANLFGANLFGADLSRADLSGASLFDTNLFDAQLYDTDLRHSSVTPNLWWKNGKCIGAKMTKFDFYLDIYITCKHKNDPKWESLTELEQKETMQKFCNETGMIIFDGDGNEVAKPEF